MTGVEWSIDQQSAVLRVRAKLADEIRIWAMPGANSSLGLTFGTGVERIGDESLTQADSGFVHRYIYLFERPWTPDHESLKPEGPTIGTAALTFGKMILRRVGMNRPNHCYI